MRASSVPAVAFLPLIMVYLNIYALLYIYFLHERKDPSYEHFSDQKPHDR